MTDDETRRVDLLALCRITHGATWNFIAREAQRPDGLSGLLAGHSHERGADAEEGLAQIAAGATNLEEQRRWVPGTIAQASDSGVRLTTVLEDDYPINLRTVFNLPPFLFYRGSLRYEDARSVAVVGTREASVEGLSRARELVTALARLNIVVLSGLAKGIDTAAHRATLDVGGRTIAVMGTGTNTVYPAENAELADQIAATGAVVSQFWPDTPPRRDTFPRRNVVTSGMSQGTVVVEASATSGARMQARLAREHGRRVFLMEHLVLHASWARGFVDRGAIVVRSVDDIVERLQSLEAIEARSAERKQLTLALS